MTTPRTVALLLLACTRATDALRLARARHAPPVMGGFEQKFFSKEGARVALLVGSVPELELQQVRDICEGAERSGIIYGLSDGRFEVVAEGARDLLEELVDGVRAAAGDDASLRAAWQAPVGGYEAAFPIVDLQPRMGARITLDGGADKLDYIQRHLQIEAVFNRGLTMTKKRPRPERIMLQCKGDSSRLKSFVRWCYNGPSLARPDDVTVEWHSI